MKNKFLLKPAVLLLTVFLFCFSSCEAKPDGQAGAEKPKFDITLEDGWEEAENTNENAVSYIKDGATITVTLVRTGTTVSPDDALEEGKTNIEKLLNENDNNLTYLIKSQNIMIDGIVGRAMLFTYSYGGSAMKSMYSYIIKNGMLYSVNCSAAKENYDNSGTELQDIVYSIKFK